MLKAIPLSESVVKKCREFGLRVSASKGKGLRPQMEDRFDARVVGDGVLVTICDGHSGSRCVDFVISKMPAAFTELFAQKRKERIGTLLKRAVKASSEAWDKKCFLGKATPKTQSQRQTFFDEKVKEEKYAKDGFESGTTLLACYIERGRCTVAHLGDSRAEWTLDGKHASTTDHKPRPINEKSDEKHISRFPVWIQLDGDVLRLNGQLAMGKCIGDNSRFMAGCISRKPDVTTFSFAKHALKLVLATDGLWDQVERNEFARDPFMFPDIVVNCKSIIRVKGNKLDDNTVVFCAQKD